MYKDGADITLPLSRPPAAGVRLERLPLRLPLGYRTSAYLCRPAGPTRGPVVYLHGIQSHPGWFVGSASALAAAGHAVYMPVRRGSGDNTRRRGHAFTYGQLLRDVAAACRFALRHSGADAFGLLGVSWGGKLAAAYAAGRRRPRPATLTLVAPGIAPLVDLPAGRKLAVLAAAVLCPLLRFGIPLNDPALFTDNEAMREYLRGASYRLRRATAGFLFASGCLDVLLRRAAAGAIDVPTTLLLASRDRIIDGAATRRAVQRLTVGRAVVRELAAAHTIEFAEQPEAFFQALAEAVVR